MSRPTGQLRAYVRDARAVYAKHAIGWSLIGGVALVISVATFWTATKVSGMAGGVAFALPVGIWMAFRWRAMRDDGPVMRLIAEPQHIVWLYRRVESVQNRSGRELKRNHQVFLGDDDGVLSSFWIAESEVERVVTLLVALAPHATAGFSEDRARAYRKEPLTLRTAIPVVPAVDGVADGAASPYREAPERADPAGDPETRRKRRRARRVRRILTAAAAVGAPLAAIGMWIAGASAEVGARARRDAERTRWWNEGASAVIDRVATDAASVTDAQPFDSACRDRLVDHDWAGVAFAASRGDGSVEASRREARGSKSMSSFSAPSGGGWGNTLGAALGTVPWRWIVLGGARPDPLFYGRLLADTSAERIVLVRMVERDTGALLCQGTVDVGWVSHSPRCAESEVWDDRAACAAATRKSYLTSFALESAVRSAMWSE